MKDRYKEILILFLVGLYAFTGVLAVAFLSGNEAKAKPSILKISSVSSKDRVDKFFKNRTNIKSTFINYEWTKGNGEVDEDTIFATVGAKTKAQKQLVRNGLEKEGYKRIKVTCKQLDSVKNNWSLGYCIDEVVSSKTSS